MNFRGVFSTEAPPYREVGLNVVPIIPGTKRPPAGIPWKQWTKRRQTEEELQKLVRLYPAADVAVLLGGWVDIETDGEAGEQALRDLRLALPETACWRSPRGVHRVYRTSQPVPSCLQLRPGLDVLASGRYAIAPHSTQREWLTSVRIQDAVSLPVAWSELLAVKGRRLSGPALDAIERDAVPEGQRNISLAALVGRWLTQAHPPEEIRRLALRWAVRCVPTLTQEEALAVVESITRTRHRKRSPEREALLLARDYGVSQPARSVFVSLVAIWQELGLPEPVLAAPHRLVADYAGVDRDSVGPALLLLVEKGLICVGTGRDPKGRPVTTVRFLVKLS